MKRSKIFLLAGLLTVCINVRGQVITLDPEIPSPSDSVVVQYDATQGTAGLQGFEGEVYAHTGVLTTASTSNSDWKYVKTEWGENTAETLMRRVDTDMYQITIGPSIREYYGVPEGETVTHITFVFRSADTSLEGKDTGGADILAEVFDATFSSVITEPVGSSIFASINESIAIRATATEVADFKLAVDGEEVMAGAQTGVTDYAYDLVVTQAEGSYDVTLTASTADSESTSSFSYTVIGETEVADRPTGIIKGINYDDSDDSRVILCLQAPGKSSVFVVGDFNDWEIESAFQMKRDDEFFWLEIEGLTSGTEYAFQYLIDGSIYVADPYADKILDANNDQFIPDSIYPDLKDYPVGARNPVGQYHVVSVLETGQSSFEWQNDDFQKPAKEELVIYELLIRDFFGNGEESYSNLIDTLSYIKSLGVNAIELMPITEFAGNDSWGYNPTFMFAVDKAYGTKDDLKRFIDASHGLGMAVILDNVLNHQDQPSPIVLMDFDLEASRPTADNPYFNQTATHPFNVFYDMNHESSYTQDFVDSVNHYWLNEYHFDGFRFDLSKGFTQRQTTDVGVWSAPDPDRIALLKRMADAIWEHSPDAYVMLEHFGDNAEEIELSNHGMMLWGNAHGSYKQNILGYEENADINWVYHGSRGWQDPHLISYMESHDEQRQMFEAIEFGNTSGDYNVQEIETALPRMEAGFAFLLTVPGPKLFWQFGEIGYDIDIDFNGRTGQKPTPWDNSEGLDYHSDFGRSLLRQRVSALVSLKTASKLFSTGEVEFTNSASLLKQMIIRNEPYTDSPSTQDEMNAVVVGNFDVASAAIIVTFPHSGTWFDYMSGSTITVTSTSLSVSLEPGQYRIFTDVALERPDVVLSQAREDLRRDLRVYPNPASYHVFVESTEDSEPLYYAIYDMLGKLTRSGKFGFGEKRIDGSGLEGLYLIELIDRRGEVGYHRVLFNR